MAVMDNETFKGFFSFSVQCMTDPYEEGLFYTRMSPEIQTTVVLTHTLLHNFGDQLVRNLGMIMKRNYWNQKAEF